MNFYKKTSFVLFLILVTIFSTSCSLFRTKEPPPPVDKTEKNLTIYNMYDSADVFDPLIQQYLTENPYTKVFYEVFYDFDEYEKRVLNELAEGEGPDIFAMPNSWFVKNKKKLIPMPETMGAVDDYEVTFVDVVSKDLVITDDEGIKRAYGVPLAVDTLALYYNKDHFEDAVPNRGRPASTWSGLKNDVYLLNKKGSTSNLFEVSGIAMGLSSNVTYGVDALFALMIQEGTVFYDEVMAKSVFASTSSGSVKPSSVAMDLYTSFSDKSQKHYSWSKYMAKDYAKNDVSAFAAGEVSMIFGYPSTYEEILTERRNLKSDSDSDTVVKISSIKTAPLPQVVDPSVSTEKRDTYADYFAFGVARTSEYSDAAWDFLTFVTNPESERYYFEQTHKPTSRRDLIQEEMLDPIYGTFAEQVGYAESFPVLDYLVNREMFEVAIEEVVDGKAASSVLMDLQNEINKLLPQLGYIVPVNTDYYEQLQTEEEKG
jgi:multiple sugar transport system substrate-binding protein